MGFTRSNKLLREKMDFLPAVQEALSTYRMVLTKKGKPPFLSTEELTVQAFDGAPGDCLEP